LKELRNTDATPQSAALSREVKKMENTVDQLLIMAKTWDGLAAERGRAITADPTPARTQ